MEAEYRQGNIAHEEYRKQEQELDALEEKLDSAEDKLELSFGMDD